MSVEEDGFLSTEVDAFAAKIRADLGRGEKLARDLNKTAIALLSTTTIPDAKRLSDPRVVARLLLGRVVSNFEGALLVSERGLAAEARALARCCLESTFYVVAALESGPEFVRRMYADAQVHRRKLAENWAQVQREDGELGEELSQILAELAGQGKPLNLTQMVGGTTIRRLFLMYRDLSADAHPTLSSLERYVKEGSEAYEFVWGPELDQQVRDELILYVCTFMITAALAYCQVVAKDREIERRLANHWDELCAWQGSKAAV